MKSSQFFITLFLATFLFSISANAQNRNKIKGEGSVTTKTLDLKTFTSIGLGISADVVLTQGNRQEVKVKGQQNIIDNIKTEVKGDSWNIEFHDRVSDHKELTIYITMETLEALSIGGSGDISCTNQFKNLKDVAISIGGSGNVSLDLNAKDIAVSIGGSGEVSLDGSGDELAISIGGSGDVKAFDCAVKTCSVSSAGSGNIEINVSDELEVSMVGSGDVNYKGDPKVKSSIVGSGDVEKVH